MKQHFNRIFCALLALMLCVGLAAMPAAAEEATSGTCGDNLTWNLENGVLTISGSGAMTDFIEPDMAPWYGSRMQIQRVVIASGITNVGDLAFFGLENLTTANIPSSVKILGNFAFAECHRLSNITISGVEQIGRNCFYSCRTLTGITLPEGLRAIGDQAFYCCYSLTGITVPSSVESLGSMVFSYCMNLAYADVKAQIDVLPFWTFYGCELLWKLSLPNSIQTVEQNALGECPELNYVDYNGTTEARAEIDRQLAQETIKERDPSVITDVDFSQTDGAVISTTTKTQVGDGNEISEPETGTTVNATVTEQSGWEDVADYIKDNNFRGEEPEIIIQTQSGTTIPAGSLEDMKDEDVVITIHTSDNVDWTIVIPHQDETSLSGAQDLSVTLKQNTSDKYADTIGDAKSYIVTMGDTTLKSTVLIPLGNDTARRTATLYLVDGNELKKLASVVVDDDGKAAFPLAGTEAGDYVVALDVQDIPQEEVRIPNKLAAEYGIEYTYGATLTDAYGNQYVLTGRVNKLGFGIGELTLIIVGVLVASIVVVGAVMFMWNKQQKRIYADAARKK